MTEHAPRPSGDTARVLWFVLGFNAGLWVARQLVHWATPRPTALVIAHGHACAPGCHCGCGGPSCACHG